MNKTTTQKLDAKTVHEAITKAWLTIKPLYSEPLTEEAIEVAEAKRQQAHKELIINHNELTAQLFNRLYWVLLEFVQRSEDGKEKEK